MTIMMMMMMIMTDPFTPNLVVKGPVVKGSVVKGAHPMVIIIMIIGIITIAIIIIKSPLSPFTLMLSSTFSTISLNSGI